MRAFWQRTRTNGKHEVPRGPIHTVGICLPAQDQCATWFAYDLARLTAYTVAVSNGQVGIQLHVIKTAYLADSRTKLTEHALHNGCTHLLWLDTDMRFPKDALLRLLAHNEPIVAASYSKRRLPLEPVASDSLTVESHHYVANDAEGLERVAVVGMGLMLVKREVFEAIPKPWFAVPYVPERDQFMGEDVFFCEKAAEYNYQVLIDAKLTNEVGHLGEWEFGNKQLNEFHERVAGVEA